MYGVQQFSTRGDSVSEETVSNVGETFLIVTTEEVTVGISRAETRDAAKHPTVYRTAPTARSHLTRNVSSAEAEKSRCSTKSTGLKPAT